MQKWQKHVCNCIRGVIVLGMSGQILFGIAWMTVNFYRCESFFQGMVFLLQLALAGAAAYRSLEALQLTARAEDTVQGSKAFREKTAWEHLRELWKVLAIVTIPGAMQCHMSILPYSAASSVFLLLLSFLLKRSGKKRQKGAVSLLLVVLLFTGSVVVGFFVQEDGRCRIKSPAEAAVSRFVWPYFDRYYVEWPKEVQEVISPQEAREISLYSDMVEAEFFPAMEKALGKEKAESCCWQMAGLIFHYHTRQIAERILWDALCYSFSPYMLKLQLDGMGYESFSGRNYDMMRQNAPVLTSLYVRYVSRWFLTGLALAVLLKILALPGRKRKAGEDIKRKSRYFLLPVLTGAVMVVSCTLSGAGIMDYKRTVTVTIIWYLWMLYEAAGNRGIKEKGM